MNDRDEAAAADWDSPWKEVLAAFLPDAIALFLPETHALIDWLRPYELLDKELQQIAPEGVGGRRVVDLLARVTLLTGAEEWLLLHVEVQGQRDAAFAQRMFTYHVRLLDHFNRDVISIAILTDAQPGWRPGPYERGGPASRVRFDYTVVKLLDWRERLSELEASANPFAVVVRAHLLALGTRRDRAGRFAPKLALVRELYQRGFERQQVINLFRFIDWVAGMPKPETARFWSTVRADEEARQMPYVTPTERYLLEQGEIKGLRTAVRLGLEVRFGAEAAAVADLADRVSTATGLQRVVAANHRGSSLADIEALLREEAE